MSDNFFCNNCSERILGEDVLKCKGCQLVFHPKCVKIDKNLLNALIISPNIFWYCNSCSSVSNLGVIAKINKLDEDVKKISKMLLDLQTKLLSVISSNEKNDDTESNGSEMLPTNSNPSLISNNKTKSKKKHYNKTNNANKLTVNKQKQVQRQNNDTELNRSTRHNNVENISNHGRNCNNSSLRAAQSKISLHVARLDKNTTTDDVKNHVSKVLSIPVIDLQCFILTKRDADVSKLRSVSFLLIIPSIFYDNVRKVENWPRGVKVKKFHHQQKNDGAALHPGEQ